jgi:4-hydroxyphenylacetate 3-monooxygenase/4-hydroxybutyryl-CoA dehydratase/vinylacetyl-CoA-Delta-isomerase
MALKTADEYVERLQRMKPNVYAHGRKIGRDDPMLELPINTLRFTFDAVNDPDLKDLLVTKSHLTGEVINRFTSLNTSIEDLYTEIDETKGTQYHDNFVEFVKTYQANDLVGSTSQTDVKGDRKARPSQQEDPDLYLHVVEKNSKGIVVRGAKNHITMGPYVDEHLVIPTRRMTEEESEWAVAFAIPADTDGIKIISRIVAPRKRINLKAPYNDYGVSGSLCVENGSLPADSPSPLPDFIAIPIVVANRLSRILSWAPRPS